MYEFIKGKVTELSPAFVVIECGGIGYFLHISLTTYSKLAIDKEFVIFTHHVVREDVEALYGFSEKEERELFRHLISVSGIGPNTARMMLSSQSPNKLREAIVTSNLNILKAIKGIGVKTAQRLIIELKDKLSHEKNTGALPFIEDNAVREESVTALVMLGFTKKAVDQVVDKIISEEKDINVEALVKKALKNL